jgi:hypothetical protein
MNSAPTSRKFQAGSNTAPISATYPFGDSKIDSRPGVLITVRRMARSLLHFANNTRKYPGDIRRDQGSKSGDRCDIGGQGGLIWRVCEAAPVSGLTAQPELTDTKGCFMSKTVYVDDKAAAYAIIIEVEEIEEVMAPKLSVNQNEILVIDEVELNVE